MKIHNLKTWPAPYAAILDGNKTFEFRENDRAFEVGDVLVLCEWDPKTSDYTGFTTSKFVTYILYGPDYGLPEGKVIMSLGDERPR